MAQAHNIDTADAIDSTMSSSVPAYSSVYFLIFITVIIAMNLDKLLKYVIYKVKNMLRGKMDEIEPMDVDTANLHYMDMDEEGDPCQMGRKLRLLKRNLEEEQETRSRWETNFASRKLRTYRRNGTITALI